MDERVRCFGPDQDTYSTAQAWLDLQGWCLIQVGTRAPEESSQYDILGIFELILVYWGKGIFQGSHSMQYLVLCNLIIYILFTSSHKNLLLNGKFMLESKSC